MEVKVIVYSKFWFTVSKEILILKGNHMSEHQLNDFKERWQKFINDDTRRLCLVESKEAKVQQIRKSVHHPRATFVGLISSRSKRLWIGIAICSGEDQFCRETGKHLAEIRARSKKCPYMKLKKGKGELKREAIDFLHIMAMGFNKNVDGYKEMINQKIEIDELKEKHHESKSNE